jgi:hypothetical protein
MMENKKSPFLIRLNHQSIDAAPFLIVALIWGVVSVGVCGYFGSQGPLNGLGLGLLFWVFTLSNLIFLVKMIEVTMILMSDQLTEKRGFYQIQLLIWVNLKLISFGGLFFLIWKLKNQVILPALFGGVGTLITVPLIGGYWWSRKGLIEDE